MKHLIFLTCLAVCFPVAAQTVPGSLGDPDVISIPTPVSTFDWKLRLTKGQNWKQTLTYDTETTSTSLTTKSRTLSKQTQSIDCQQEVLAASPAFYTIRYTFTRLDLKGSTTTDGKTYPTAVPPKILKALTGASFTMKQKATGEIIEVAGIEDFLIRTKRAVKADAKTAAEREATERALPTATALRQMILAGGNNFQPKTPLSQGQNYSYNILIPLAEISPDPISMKVTRTLRRFDSRSAQFDNSALFDITPKRPLRTPTTTIYSALQVKVSGPLTVDSASGIISQANVTTTVKGKITLVGPGKYRESGLIATTSRLIIATQKDDPR